MRVKNIVICCIIGLVCLFGGFWGKAESQVNVHVGIAAPPPPYMFSAPPSVMVIPRSYVYYVPGIPAEVFFYRGYWYRSFEGRWYRAKSYNGTWRYLTPPRVPHALLALPPGYRAIPPGHQKIPYGQLKKNWSRWERQKYWHKHAGWNGNEYQGPPPKSGQGHWKNHGGPPGKAVGGPPGKVGGGPPGKVGGGPHGIGKGPR